MGVDPPLRLAMWSGPRNVSTALMRSFDSRADTTVCDEPLYAHYLLVTGRPHPGADEVVRRHENDWRRVARRLTGPVPGGARVFYQKHMAHHLLPHVGRDWLERLEHAFLVREPRAMLASLTKVVPEPRVPDTGLPQQARLFEEVRRRSGAAPPVIEARDLLEDPAGILARLCDRVGLDFDPAMLAWAPGPRDTDGCWGPHWYDSVYASTGFAPASPRDVDLPAALEPVLAECERHYQILHEHRLRSA